MSAVLEPLNLSISGMTCAGCAGRVERVLTKVAGVERVSVNLATERAQIELRDAVDPLVLIHTVESAGYGASLPQPEGDDVQRQRQLRGERLALVAALLLAAPLVLPMVLGVFGVPLMLAPWLQWALATPVQFVLGARFYRAAFSALRAGSANMDVLVALGTSAGYGLSLYELWRGAPGSMPHLYFEASAVVIALVLLGKYLESRARRQTASAIRALEGLRPEFAVVWLGGNQKSVPISSVRRGDRVVVKPGERFPVDGEVLEGASHADEALISGESQPVPKALGDRVIGGSINGEGRLLVRTQAIGAQSVLARIIRLVENAQAAKAPIQTLVDRVTRVFVPVIVLIALATLGGWLWLGAGVNVALINAVSVLVIACPCALGLATPAAIMAGTGVAARYGILIKDVDSLEKARRITHVVFDKTGTLTRGTPSLLRCAALDGDTTGLLSLAGALQRGSEHPLAKAVLDACRERQLSLPAADQSKALPGRGTQARVGGRLLVLGSQRLLDEQQLSAGELADSARHWQAQGRSLAWLLELEPQPRVLGLLVFGDDLKDGARQAVEQLHALSITSHLLTGDNRGSAEAVARQVGITRVEAEVLPADKMAVIQRLQQQGAIAMVGDGLNDAPALAAADIGMAMGGGADAALHAAGITLMRGDPRLVPAALDICRRTYGKIRQNLFWAMIYNLIGIPLAAFGLLDPVIAAAAMALSSLCVVSNALLLKTWKP